MLAGAYVLGEPGKEKGLWIKIAGGMYNEYWLRMKREGRYPSFMDGDIGIGLDKVESINNYEQVSSTYDFKK